MLFRPMLSIAAILLILGLKGKLSDTIDISCFSFRPFDTFISAELGISISRVWLISVFILVYIRIRLVTFV
jgi:hypothetical protein